MKFPVDALPRPLDAVPSLKLKIGVLLLASGGAGLAYLWLEYRWVPSVPIALVTVGVVLATAQLLGHGMTRPLREMTAAARSMAQGDYTRRVHAGSSDEVGQLAAAFNRMAADLAAADRQRRELIANVSHELRTPITALQAVLENVVDGVAPPDPATLRTALAQTERLGRLVAELLDLSRIDAGALALEPRTFEVEPLLAAAVAEAEVAAGVAGRRVDFTLDVASGVVAHADGARLHQVVTNLLDNAARHAPAGSAVHVTAWEDDGGLVLEVRDAGPGIPAEERERVFHRFTRGERAAGGGTGLGLAIARWAVDLHGGRITVVGPDESPQAAAVRATLPPDTPAAGRGVHGAPAPIAAPSTTGPGCRIRVTLPRPS